jgi:hypothetical protein
MTKNRKLNKTGEMDGRGLLTTLITISANLCADSAVNKVKIDDKLLEWLLNSRVTHLFLANAFILEYITDGTLPKLPTEYQPILYFDDF